MIDICMIDSQLIQTEANLHVLMYKSVHNMYLFTGDILN
jgi:hypothetical protein